MKQERKIFMKTFLERSATTYGGRDGLIKDMASQTELKLVKPVEMGGKEGLGTNPEELFAAGYSSCFASSIEYLLMSNQVAYDAISVKATTQLLADPERGFSFKLIVDAKITGVDQETEKSYIEKAYGFCPYSKAIKGNVEVVFI
jgi:Ohr subfamily peroxiredoxin